MNSIHDVHDHNSFHYLSILSYIRHQAVGRLDRILHNVGARKKEMIMRAHGHTTVWGTPIGVSRATDGKRWYQQLTEWWAAHKAARHDATLATLSARWDARREVVTPFRAEAAPEMAAAHRTLSVATMLYGLAV
jgi:hypothetical protein